MTKANAISTSSRRGMLVGTTAALLGAVSLASGRPAGTGEDQDAELLTLSATFCALEDKILDLFPGGANAIKDDKERDFAQEPYWQQQQAIAARINEIRATTYEGAIARARAAVKWAPDLVEPDANDPHAFHETIVAALLRDLIGEAEMAKIGREPGR